MALRPASGAAGAAAVAARHPLEAVKGRIRTADFITMPQRAGSRASEVMPAEPWMSYEG